MKYLMLSFLFLPLNLAFSQSKETPLVSTVLGVQAVGYRDFSGPPILLLPVRLASDLAGNVFVVDRVGNKVWKITPNGVAVLFAGSGFEGHWDSKDRSLPIPSTVSSSAAGLVGEKVSLNIPSDVTVDQQGNVYISDLYNNQIRKISPEGILSTLVGNGESGKKDGIGLDATVAFPDNLTVDRNGNIYFTQQASLLRVTSSEGVTKSFAEDYLLGKGVRAQEWDPPSTSGIAIDSRGVLFVVSLDKQSIIEVLPDGSQNVFVGSGHRGYLNGKGESAAFNLERGSGIAIDSAGNLFIADSGNSVIRKVTVDGVVTTVAGNGKEGYVDGNSEQAMFRHPQGIAIDRHGYVFVADTGNRVVRKISTSSANSTVPIDLGSFQIYSLDAGNVFLDGNLIRRINSIKDGLPFDLLNVPTGTHVLELRYGKDLRESHEVLVEPGQIKRVVFGLDNQ